MGRDTQARMMMKATPIAPFVMPQPQLLLEFEVVTLDAPTHLDGGHESPEGNVCGQGGQKIAGRLGVSFGPFDEQPFFLAGAIGVGGAPPGAARGCGAAPGPRWPGPSPVDAHPTTRKWPAGSPPRRSAPVRSNDHATPR